MATKWIVAITSALVGAVATLGAATLSWLGKRESLDQRLATQLRDELREELDEAKATRENLEDRVDELEATVERYEQALWAYRRELIDADDVDRDPDQLLDDAGIDPSILED